LSREGVIEDKVDFSKHRSRKRFVKLYRRSTI